MNMLKMYTEPREVEPTIMYMSDEDFADLKVDAVIEELTGMVADAEPVEKVKPEPSLYELPTLMEVADPKVLNHVIEMLGSHPKVSIVVDSYDTAVQALEFLPASDKKRLYSLLTKHKLDRM